MASIVNLMNAIRIRPDSKRLIQMFQSVRTDLVALNSNVSTHLLTSGGLAIKAGGSALAKTTGTYQAVIGGVLVSKAAGDMAALVGTVTNTKFNVYVFYIDSTGTVTTSMGTEGATLAAVVAPATPTSKAAIGFVIINPTGTGNFVGGTTALDDGTVAPNAVYVNTIGTFRPTVTTVNTLTTTP